MTVIPLFIDARYAEHGVGPERGKRVSQVD